MNLHDSPYNNGLLFVNFNQDFGKNGFYDFAEICFVEEDDKPLMKNKTDKRT